MPWPPHLNPIVSRLAERLGYSALTPLQELSGDSGAQTFLCGPDSPLGRPHPIVVKCGPSAVLEADIAGLRRATTHFRGADYGLDNAVTADGITAIPLRLLGSEVENFGEFLARTGEDSPELTAAIEELFTEVVRLPHLTNRLSGANAFTLYEFSGEVARALLECGDDVPDLLVWWRHAARTWRAGSVVRLCHGDLHFGNVLRTLDPPGLHVIDFGRTGEHHAFRDLAKFERELHLARWRSDPGAAGGPLGGGPATACIRALVDTYAQPGTKVEVEYRIALLAQFIFATANTALPEALRRKALATARAIQAELVAMVPQLELPAEVAREARRLEAMWRFCYVYSRLDQLPSGGWGRGLKNWMEALWVGDEGQIMRNPDMRTSGGSDLTSYAVVGWTEFMHRHFTPQAAARLFNQNQVLYRASENLARRIGFEGGTGTGRASHAHADVRIRHTAMTALALMHYQIGHDYGSAATDVLAENFRYLVRYLPQWKRDTPHIFASVMASTKLAELVATDVGRVGQGLADDLRDVLAAVLTEMVLWLEHEPRDIKYRPHPRHEESIPRPPLFVPYGNFWRMERANLLMYLGFAVNREGTGLLEPVGGRLGSRFAQCFDELLEDIAIPFDSNDPEASLVRYHRGPRAGREAPVRDWGLSAELAALLTVPAIEELLKRHRPGQFRTIERRREALCQALLATIDRFQDLPELFRFAQSAAFLRAERAFPQVAPTEGAIRELDEAVRRAVAAGLTEVALSTLVREVVAVHGEVDTDALTALLVARLEAGEYVADDAEWERLAAQGRGHAARRAVEDLDSADLNLSMLRRRKDDVRRALVVRDGTAGHRFSTAELFAAQGFSVTDIDFATFAGGGPEGKFEAVVLGHALMYLPRTKAAWVLQDLVTVVEPGGYIFATFTLGDHAIISVRGFFIQYYRDESAVRVLLEEAGLVVTQVFTNYQAPPGGTVRKHFVCLNGTG